MSFSLRISQVYVIAVLVVVCGSVPLFADAAMYTVTKPADTNDGVCDADCSLREAIIVSNATPDDDAITLPAGTYALTLTGADEDEAATGDLDVVNPYGEGSLAIYGAGMTTTIIDGQHADRVIDQLEGPWSAIPLSLSNLTIQNGYIDRYAGGGIYSEAALSLYKVKVTRNKTFRSIGGGIYASAESLSISNSIISDNAARHRGGGIDIGNVLSADITNTTITRNRVTDEEYGYGGGLSMYYAFGSLMMSNTTISDNFAAQDGGGMWIGDVNDPITVRGINLTISGNSTNGNGGGIDTYFPVYLTNSTVAYNVADANRDGVGHGGGIFVESLSSIIKNSILANNEDWNTVDPQPDCGVLSVLYSWDYNVVSDTSGCAMTAAAHDLLDVDPLLKPLGNYGGNTRSHAITPLSPAYNLVPTAECVDVDGVAVTQDQRGMSRPMDGACEAGAFEVVQLVNAALEVFDANDVLTKTRETGKI